MAPRTPNTSAWRWRPGWVRVTSTTPVFYEQTPRGDGRVASRCNGPRLCVSPQTPKEQFSEKPVSHVLWVPRVGSTWPYPAAGTVPCRAAGAPSPDRTISVNLALRTNSLRGRTPTELAPFPGRIQGRISKYTFQSVVICENKFSKNILRIKARNLVKKSPMKKIYKVFPQMLVRT